MSELWVYSELLGYNKSDYGFETKEESFAQFIKEKLYSHNETIRIIENKLKRAKAERNLFYEKHSEEINKNPEQYI